MNRPFLFPEPQFFRIHSGVYNVPPVITFSGYKSRRIQKSVETIIGEYLRMQKNDTAAVFYLEILNESVSEEYTVSIDSGGIRITASSEKGLVNGLLTVKQLFIVYMKKLPYLQIKDSPLFSWRGIMIDVCRHFHDANEIKRLIPVLAIFKINTLHLHLSEDQGWRFESSRYPELTLKGSVREKTMVSCKNPITYRNSPHGGFLRKSELTEITELAAACNMQVIPEIEMPGHSLAALASYPELGCTGKEYKVGCDFGIIRDVMCPGKDSTLEFCRNILKEVSEVFPAEYIHIGGDEVPVERWESCSECRKRKEQLGLESFRELQYWFNEEIRKYAESLGKKIICWNEAVYPGVDKEILIQYWYRNKKNFADFISAGGKGIISDYRSLYLDHSHRFSSLKDVYTAVDNYEKLIASGNILGIEAPLWTEWVPNRERLDHQLFPRVAALAEAAWHGGKARRKFMSGGSINQLYRLFEQLGVFPADRKTANPLVLFKKAARLKELKRPWDTAEYRKMPVAGVPNDLDTRIR